MTNCPLYLSIYLFNLIWSILQLKIQFDSVIFIIPLLLLLFSLIDMTALFNSNMYRFYTSEILMCYDQLNENDNINIIFKVK